MEDKMDGDITNQCSPHGFGIVTLEIPLTQFLVADLEPLSAEEEEIVIGLVREIEEDGLRSLPEVFYVCTEEGKHFYRIHNGKKRWYAFAFLEREFLICRVVPLSDVIEGELLA